MKLLLILILSITILSSCDKEPEVRKPELPVKVSFRKAMLGPGNVLVLNTTVKTTVPVLVTVHSSALGTTKAFELHLDPSHANELGHLEGAVIENGDEIKIENLNYAPLHFRTTF